MFFRQIFASAKIKEICENQEGFTLNYHNKSAIKILSFPQMWGRGNSNVTPIYLRTKLDESPFYVRYYSGGSSSLVRRYKAISAFRPILSRNPTP